MKKILILSLILNWCKHSNAQSVNLIANSSYEFYNPNPYFVIDTSFNSNNGLLCWRTATWGAVIYRSNSVQLNICPISSSLNACNHLPRSGESYVQLMQKRYQIDYPNDSAFNNVGYLQTKLLAPLQQGSVYKLTGFVSAAVDDSSYVSDIWTSSPNLGFLFTTNPIDDFSTVQGLIASPQITISPGNYLTDPYSWIQVSGTFVANGGEEYLTVGNFASFSNTITYPYVPYQQIGNYIVTSLINIDDISLVPDTTTTIISPNILNIGNDTIMCNNQIINDTLIAQPGFFHYLWNTGDTSESIIINGPGIYWCSVDFGCNWFTDSISIIMDSSIQVLLPNDTALCSTDFPFIVTEVNEQANYYWNTGDTTSSISINTPGTYWVKTITACSEHVDSIHVSLINTPSLDLGSDTSFCADQLLNFIVAAQPGFTTYQWSNGSQSPSIIITDPGNYSLSASFTCGVINDEIKVMIDSIPSVNLGDDVVLCKGEQLTLDAKQNFSVQYYWNTEDSTSELNVYEAGLYSVSVENNCGLAADTIIVDEIDCNHCVFVPNAFTPNGDGINDEFKPILQCPVISDYRLNVFNRWGEKVFESVDPEMGWNGITKDKPQSMDTYIYLVQYAIGEINVSKVEKGSVILIR